MVGIIAAGGNGTRLRPHTLLLSKCFYPIYDVPLLYFPLRALSLSGIKKVIVTTRPDTLDQHKKLYDSGFYEQFKFEKVEFITQAAPLGLPDAIRTAKNFVKDEPIMVLVGDNVYTDDFSSMVQSYKGGCMISLFNTQNLREYGVASASKNSNNTFTVHDLEEKPQEPKGSFASVTPYIFDTDVFERIERLRPSARGELEIIDLQKSYLNDGLLSAYELSGAWFDCGNKDEVLKVVKHRLSELNID